MPDSMLFLDATMLSRIQFGFTITFHILFPALSIGLAGFLVVSQTAATFTHAVRGGRIAGVATLSLAWIADSGSADPDPHLG